MMPLTLLLSRMPCKFARQITLLICLLALSQETLILRLAFICPEGSTPKQKSSYFPTSNGCGGSEGQVLLGSVLNPFTPSLVGCCNTHDMCFGTCNLAGASSFTNCNDQFRSCLQSQCLKMDFFLQLQCSLWSEAYSLLVKTIGSRYYSNSQLGACTCQ